MKLSILALISIFAISLMTSCSGTSPYGNYQYLSPYKISDAVSTIKTNDSVQIYVINNGTGPAPQIYDSVVVSIVYEALRPTTSTTYSVTEYRTSATTYGFRLGIDNQIPGLQEAILLLKQGSEARVFIPSKLAYGAEGYKGTYPFADYLCDIQIVSVTHSTLFTPLSFNTTGKDTVKLSSGLKYIKCLEVPTAAKVDSGNYVFVNYTGYLTNGDVFDLSRNGKFGFIAGSTGVIKGMSDAVELMKVGEQFRFLMPYSLCYGAASTGKIGPFSDLIFDIQLVSVVATKK